MMAQMFPFDNNRDFSRQIEFVLSDWHISLFPGNLPSHPGLYIIHDRATSAHLYIGQAQNLNNRFQRHWAWRRAKHSHGLPRIAYKLIKCETYDKTLRELLFNECLLIGLLHPHWNVATPPPKNDFIPNEQERLKLIHWSEVVGKHYEPFQSSMLTSKGCVIAKRVSLEMPSGKVEMRWRRVLYDRKYVEELAKDLANQVDIFFILQS